MEYLKDEVVTTNEITILVPILYNTRSILTVYNYFSLMNQSNIKTTKIKTFSQCLTVFWCCVWCYFGLIGSLATIAHAQEYAVIETHNSQDCLEDENPSSEKMPCQFFVPFIPVINAITGYKDPLSTNIFQLILGNRDPPFYGML